MPHLPSIVSGTPGDKGVTAAASKGGNKQYIGWWQRIEQMFDKGLMLNLRCDPYTKEPCEDGLWIQCAFCQMSEGASDGYITLRWPFDQYYYDQHVEQC